MFLFVAALLVAQSGPRDGRHCRGRGLHHRVPGHPR